MNPARSTVSLTSVSTRELPLGFTLCQQSGARRVPASVPVQTFPLRFFSDSKPGHKMTFRGFLSAALVSVCWVFVSATQTPLNSSAPLDAAASTSSTGNSTRGARPSGKFFKDLGVDSSMIQRALYVLIGFTMIGVLYFLIRAVRWGRTVLIQNCDSQSNFDSLSLRNTEPAKFWWSFL